MANSRKARKTTKAAQVAMSPVPRSSLPPDLADLVLRAALGIAPDRLEPDPHQRAQAGHDQHGDGGLQVRSRHPAPADRGRRLHRGVAHLTRLPRAPLSGLEEGDL